MLEDEWLKWKLRHGSREALARVYEKYVDAMLTLAMGLLNQRAAAEDVVQDVFLSFARSAQDLRPQGSLRSYLATSVLNRVRDSRRQQRRQACREAEFCRSAAMENVNWMQMINKTGKGVAWYSFASKIQIAVDSQGRIIYCDFNDGRKLVWNPGSQDIYESRISPTSQTMARVNGPFEAFTKMFDSLEAGNGWKVTKGLGTYQDRKVEIWTANRAKGESGLTSTWTMYIDVEKKLPMAFTDDLKGSDGNVRPTAETEFRYPETGPADIYAAGAPKSAQIKPAPEGQPSGEQVPPK